MDYKDYYQVLGVPKTAGAEEIKKKYRKLAVQFHPDKNQGNKSAEDKFKEISEAYEVLGDPEKRKKYDQLGQNWKQRGGSYSTGRQAGRNDEFGDFFGGGTGFSDFFEAFFGSQSTGFGRPKQRAMRGRDLESVLELSLSEAYHGTERIVLVNDNQVKMTIKAGVRDGQLLRMKGKGQSGRNGGASGDLLIHVKLIPHPEYSFEEKELMKTVPVDFYTAVLGGKVHTEVFGKTIQVPVKANTQTGAMLRLKNLGMPEYGSIERGNLLLHLKIVLPPEISDSETELIRKASELRNH
jgi:curved DNA-binding protein